MEAWWEATTRHRFSEADDSNGKRSGGGPWGGWQPRDEIRGIQLFGHLPEDGGEAQIPFPLRSGSGPQEILDPTFDGHRSGARLAVPVPSSPTLYATEPEPFQEPGVRPGGGRAGRSPALRRTLHSSRPGVNHGGDRQLLDNGSPGASAGAWGTRILILHRVRTTRRALEARCGTPWATSGPGDRKLG